MTQTIRRPKTALPAIDDVTRREFLFGAAGLLILPAACGDGGNEGSGRTRTFEHAVGESEVPVRPRRVASLHDTMVTYPLLDLGFEPAASAGIEGEIRAGENYVSDLEFLGQVTEPNIERIAALEPDLISGLEANNAAQYDRLSRIAPTVLMEDAPKRSLFDFHRRLADLVGRMPEYDELVARVDRRTASLRSASSHSPRSWR
jgi:iron complex transport system substrate-binding protein